MTIYIDIIFLENLFMNYIILFATGVIIKSPIKIIRTFIASLIGSIYSILSYTSSLPIYSNIFLKIILSIVIIYICFAPKFLKIFLKELFIFYLTSFTFGGVAFAFLYFINAQRFLFRNGVLIGTYPIKIILFAGISGFIIITTAFKLIKNKLSKNDMLYDLKINFNSTNVYLKALLDTGNFLKEPITKTPVIIVEKNSLINVIPNNILDNLQSIINGENFDIGDDIAKIRLIPFSSLGKENRFIVRNKSRKCNCLSR